LKIGLSKVGMKNRNKKGKIIKRRDWVIKRQIREISNAKYSILNIQLQGSSFLCWIFNIGYWILEIQDISNFQYSSMGQWIIQNRLS
jgi:hypothetical protein